MLPPGSVRRDSASGILPVAMSFLTSAGACCQCTIASGISPQSTSTPFAISQMWVICGKDALLVGEDHGNSTGSFADLPAYPLFSRAVKRRKRLIEQQEIIITGKNTGEMQALQLAPARARGPAFLPKHRYLLTGYVIRFKAPGCTFLREGESGDMEFGELEREHSLGDALPVHCPIFQCTQPGHHEGKGGFPAADIPAHQMNPGKKRRLP